MLLTSEAQSLVQESVLQISSVIAGNCCMRTSFASQHSDVPTGFAIVMLHQAASMCRDDLWMPVQLASNSIQARA